MKKVDLEPAGPMVVAVTVSPGDFGTKYKTLRPEDGGINREVDRAWARELYRSPDWEAMCKQGRLRLIDLNDGTFLIADGQHRIYAASEFGTETVTMYADIEPMSFLDGMKPGDLVQALNTSKRYRVKDRLRNKSLESIWPAAFEKVNLFPVYQHSTKVLCWPNVMRGIFNGSSVWTSHSFPGRTPSGVDQDTLWATKDAALVKKVATIMAWWQPGADEARQKAGITALHSSMAYSFAYVLWLSNEDEKTAREEAPMRLARWKFLSRVTGRNTWVNWDFWKDMLEGINYARQKHLLELTVTSVNAGRKKKSK